MVASIGEQTGLQIVLSSPKIDFTAGSPNTVTIDPDGSAVKTISQKMRSYTHTKNVIGGFLTAEIGTTISADELSWWITYGVGLSVQVMGPEQTVVWEGFVDRIALGIGGLAYNVGPLTQSANRVSVVYTGEDTSTDPPTTGVRWQTDYAESEDSQRRYGILEKVLSTGAISHTAVGYVRDGYLVENAWPGRSNRYATGSSNSEIGLSISCLGWFHRLNYPYYSEASGGQSISSKLEAILDAEPNGLFSSSNANISTNGALVNAWETDNKDAVGLIKGLVAIGDASLNRYLFTVGAGRTVLYSVIPSSIEYQAALSDPTGRIRRLGGGTLEPWLIEPGKWLWYTDLLPGNEQETEIGRMPDRMFVEQVTYTAPYGVSLQSGPSGRLPQMMAQLGLSGIGG